MPAAQFVSGALLAVAFSAFALPAIADEAQLARGRYLVTIMDCAGCHTPLGPEGMPDMAMALQGANYGFELPGLGTFVPPNITPDVETGIGAWSEAEIIAAVTTGVRPDGRILVPFMPYLSYAALTPEDAAALAAYLKSIPAVSYEAPGPWGIGEKPTVPFFRVTMPE